MKACSNHIKSLKFQHVSLSNSSPFHALSNSVLCQAYMMSFTTTREQQATKAFGEEHLSIHHLLQHSNCVHQEMSKHSNCILYNDLRGRSMVQSHGSKIKAAEIDSNRSIMELCRIIQNICSKIAQMVGTASSSNPKAHACSLHSLSNGKQHQTACC